MAGTDVVQVEGKEAFDALRKALQPWREINPTCSVAMGGDSHGGEWSIVHEGGEWLVFVGERGTRMNVAKFCNPWDAVSYAGYRATAGLEPIAPFPVIYPVLHI